MVSPSKVPPSPPGQPGGSLSFHSGKPFTTHHVDHHASKTKGAVIVPGAGWGGSHDQSSFSEATAPKCGTDSASGQGVGHPYRKVLIMLTRITRQLVPLSLPPPYLSQTASGPSTTLPTANSLCSPVQ